MEPDDTSSATPQEADPNPEPSTVESDAAEPEVTPEPDAEATKVRAPRTDLESDLKQVLDDYVTGELTIEGDKPLTPYAISKVIGQRRGTDPPSVGAVSAALERWVKIGFISVTAKPTAFDDYTDDGRNLGLAALKARHREQRKADRAAAKGTPATPAPQPDPEPAPTESTDTSDAPF